MCGTRPLGPLRVQKLKSSRRANVFCSSLNNGHQGRVIRLVPRIVAFDRSGFFALKNWNFCVRMSPTGRHPHRARDLTTPTPNSQKTTLRVGPLATSVRTEASGTPGGPNNQARAPVSPECQSPPSAVDWVSSRSHSAGLGGAQSGQLGRAVYLK